MISALWLIAGVVIGAGLGAAWLMLVIGRHIGVPNW